MWKQQDVLSSQFLCVFLSIYLLRLVIHCLFLLFVYCFVYYLFVLLVLFVLFVSLLAEVQLPSVSLPKWKDTLVFEILLKFSSLSAVHSYDLYHIHFTSFSSYNGYKLNSHLTCFRCGFIIQSVEHRTGIADHGSNPVGASEFFSGLYLSQFESRTAQMSTLFHIFTCAFCLL